MEMKKDFIKKICLSPTWNKNNGQVNFSLKKKSLPSDIKNKLPKLKGIKVNLVDFEFE